MIHPGIKGETFVYTGDEENIDKIIDNLKIEVVRKQYLGNLEITYGLSPRLKGGVYLNGQRVNVQVARRGNTVTIGTPLIYGSY